MDGIENFICFLIDNCEGEEISESFLQVKLSEFIKNTQYNKIGQEPKFKCSCCGEYYHAIFESGLCVGCFEAKDGES